LGGFLRACRDAPATAVSLLLNRNTRIGDMLALAAGLALPLAFAPFSFSPLAILAPAVLFWLWRAGGPARCAWRGWLFGLGMFGVGVSWVYVSMHDFGNMAAPLAVFATALFVAGLALYPAALGYVQARVRGASDTVHLVAVLPSLWMLFEWWRGWFLTGFPWLNLGYSQAASWLAGYAPWLGVYGVSYFAALSAGLLALVATGIGARRMALAAMFFAIVWAGGWAAGRVEWAQPAGAPLRVALAQGNVPLRVKWQPAERNRIIERYFELSAPALGRDLIVWPEAAIPAYWQHVGAVRAALEQAARSRGTEFLIGVVESDQARRAVYNSVVSVGANPSSYRKQHLVPFGEYLPLPFLFRWLIDSMQIPMSDFDRGAPPQPPLRAAGRVIGASVCYEDAFGEEVIRTLPEAGLLVNVSEDAWFGDSLAPHQRVQMAQMRAIESARPMLRAANTGPSVVVDHRGVVLARSRQFEAALLTADVQPMRGATPYVRMGNLAAVLLASIVLVLGLGWLARRGRGEGGGGRH
jgi:apolipoprotein N-acyltransferase